MCPLAPPPPPTPARLPPAPPHYHPACLAAVVENLLSKEDLVSMDRGCVCCSLRNDIVGALRELQGRASSRGIAYDAILLETTGLADPAPVAFTFFANSWISANYRLDSILCLVDAQHLLKVGAGGARGWGDGVCCAAGPPAATRAGAAACRLPMVAAAAAPARCRCTAAHAAPPPPPPPRPRRSTWRTRAAAT